MCTVDSTVNATSTPSLDILFEVFSLQFNGTITLNKTCPHNGSSSSLTKEISSPATIKLSVVCSLHSEKFSCGAVGLKSAETKKVHMTHHRMIVHQDDLEEKEVEITNKTFIRNNIPPSSTTFQSTFSLPKTSVAYQTPLIITGAILATIIIMAITARFIMTRSTKENPINSNNYNIFMTHAIAPG